MIKKLMELRAFKGLKMFAPWGLAAMLFGVGIGFGGSLHTPAQASISYDNLRTFAEVLSLIQNYYVEEKTTKELAVGAIKGLLRTLDPHSAYMDVSTYKNRREETEGKFGGLGIEITLLDSWVTIVAPIEDTPAEKQGLLSGDQIVKIDGKSTKNLDLYGAVKKMRGQIGTSVTITIYREDTDETFDVTIIRALIKIHSVKSSMINNDVAYVRIATFSQETAMDVKKALDKFKEENKFKALVLDLRNNPGGLLKQAVDVTDLFVGKGHTIVSTRGRSVEQNSKYVSNNWGSKTEFPIVVLINAGSASASEIVAGAMQDLKRAVIIGDRSFGKGSVQTIRQLSDGSGLSLTTARYYTPSGRMIHGIGIEPDVPVKLILKDDDGEKIDIPEPIREKDLMNNFNGKEVFKNKPHNSKKPKSKKPQIAKRTKQDFKNKRIFNMEKDNQLRKAMDVLKDLRKSWVTTSHNF